MTVSTAAFCCRSELRQLLQVSDHYKVQMLLAKLQDTDMYAECAILYSKVCTESLMLHKDINSLLLLLLSLDVPVFLNKRYKVKAVLQQELSV